MDNRYNMLKNAMCRNIKEYNKRFKKRELNPNEGHAYLPYLVLIVDEFADLEPLTQSQFDLERGWHNEQFQLWSEKPYTDSCYD